MAELRVLFDRKGKGKGKGGGHDVRLVPPSGAGVPGAEGFAPDLTEEDYEDMRWYLESYMDLPDGGSVVRAGRVEEKLRRWGRSLYDALFRSREQGRLLDELFDQDGPRLLTIATEDSALLRLPWELLADRRGPLSRQGVTLRRQLEQGGRRVDYRVHLPLRVLVVVSRPADLGWIDPRLTTGAMLDALDSLGSQVVVDFCRPPTLERMEKMLADGETRGRPYHVLHFEGHGTFLADVGLGALAFEKTAASAAAPSDFVRADRLGSLLAAHRIPLTILEACRSSAVGKVPAFRSVAPRLVEAGVGSVVAMSHAVHVEATRLLFERFYREVVAGRSIGQALEAGRGTLLAQPHRWIEAGPGGRTVELLDWFLPTLYQQGEDLSLVPPEATLPGALAETGDTRSRRRPLPGRDELGAFPRPPLYRFHGRAAELYRLEGEFRRHRSVLLHAMGGMGKTTLAREAAHWWTRTGLFPDGACFLSFEQGAGADHVIRVLGTYLEGPEFERRPVEEQARRARELFDERRVLMVWDNFESVLPAFEPGSAQGPEGVPLYSAEERGHIVELFRDWTESETGRGRLLVTCRPAEAGLLGAHELELQGLSRPDSLHLLARVLEVKGVELPKRQDLEELLTLLGDHPLSVELVAPHLKDMSPEKIVKDFASLLNRFQGPAEVERNQSLLASLEFSTRRLSPETRSALPWLGLFRGGVFEQVLLRVSELDPGVWEGARQELESTALVRVERELQLTARPYLRFHPTLAYQAADQAPASDEVRRRFVAVYGGVEGAVYQALRGTQPKAGLEVLAREEANFRVAVGWALEAGEYGVASDLGETFARYLQMSGRLRERDSWVTWLASEVGRGGFTEATVGRERDAAWTLFTQGRFQEAVARLEALLERLRHATDFDPAFQLAYTQTMLGRVYYSGGLSGQAIPLLEEAVGQWEGLVKGKEARGEDSTAERGNLSATLGDLSNALQSAGRLDEALAASKRGLALRRELGHDREIAAGLVQVAQILKDQGRFQEADEGYQEALVAARQAGDRELEGTALQHRGSLADDQGRLTQATELYRQALTLFQDMNDEASVMRTSNLLGVVERKAGRLAEARAWYERSREIAQRLGDQDSLGIAFQNLGIVSQKEGEAARRAGDEDTARRRFQEAAASVNESLSLKKKRANEPGAADSHDQLGRIHLLLGELDEAQEHAHQAREIQERLGLKGVYVSYNTLAEIAHARGEDEEAAQWRQKHDELVAELERRARGPAGSAGLPPEAVQALLTLAAACARSGLEGADLPPDAESTLAQLDELPPPLRSLSGTYRALAAGEVPSLPSGLPAALEEGLKELLAAVAEARGGG